MKSFNLYVTISLCTMAVAWLLEVSVFAQSPRYVLIVHGGAGNLTPENTTADQIEAVFSGLQNALDTGETILKAGGSALDAVEAAVRVLEDDSTFNAGRGAVLNAKGEVELDAAIMDGSNIKAGAVAGVQTVKNPITLARRVMEATPHVMLIGSGAEEFAKQQQLEIVDQNYFKTIRRRSEHRRLIQQQELQERGGTVGAVALDSEGNLAAATSTGGMAMKRYGRVGDVPVIGAGTYANNNSCAVSATGHGEFFIRNVVSYDIAALMKYKGMPLKEAAHYVIMDKLAEQGGKGGVIAVDREGNFSMPFNTSAMARGFVTSDGRTGKLIFRE
ncbi:MAG TPA: isoaspartyl peptidase/L-asparaginase [Bacteroidales bacterium]|nr:isoaspartyl peptidase/L-asparaginase [Bacteroidales bacterium]